LRILVVKLGALGDFVQAMGPFAAIREHHAEAKITLLTTKPYAPLGRASPYFDEIWIDIKPKALQIGKWLDLRGRLRRGGFDRVYDLQTSDRSGFYLKLMRSGNRPEWSGIAKGCSHPHANPRRDFMHTIARQAEQLAMAGIEKTPFPDLSWVKADTTGFKLPEKYALLVPGGAPHRPAKRWPAESYGALANRLIEAGVTPVLLGTSAEAEVLEGVTKICPGAVNLADQTSFLEIAALAKKAQFAVGNDTGPMHMISLTGCPSVALYSHDSDPALCAQKGPKVVILRHPSLAELSQDEVLETIKAL
jgi:ADP-heptose:LPS heptosyltransferase